MATTRSGPNDRAASASRTEESTPPENATPRRSTSASIAPTCAVTRSANSTASLSGLAVIAAPFVQHRSFLVRPPVSAPHATPQGGDGSAAYGYDILAGTAQTRCRAHRFVEA